MKKGILTILLCAVLAMALLAGCSDNNNNNPAIGDTITITDHNGNVVNLPSDIQRIVCTDIYPFPSVLSAFLGSADKIVGIHPTSMSAAKIGMLGEVYPEILNVETGFMDGMNINIEELIKLNPDVVFYSGSNEPLGETIRNAGLNAVAVSTTKWGYDILETYNQWIALLGEIFPASDKSQAVAQYSQEVYDMIQGRIANIAEEDKKDVFFLFQYDDSRIVTSGKNFFGQFWAESVGARNASQEIEADNANATVNMEQIYKWAPDIILITNFNSAQPQDLYNNTIGNYDWSVVPAVKNKQVYKMPLGMYRSYTPGIDTPITLLWMSKTVYPDLFADIDLTKKVKDYYDKLYDVQLTDKQVQNMFYPSSEGTAQSDLR